MKVTILLMTLGVPTGIPHWYTPEHLAPIVTANLVDCYDKASAIISQHQDARGKIFVEFSCEDAR